MALIETITINKGALFKALLEWENGARNGETLTADEARALPVEEVAKDGADYLWGLLQAQPKDVMQAS